MTARRNPKLTWGDEHGVIASVGERQFGWTRHGALWRVHEWPKGVEVQSSVSWGVGTKEAAIEAARAKALAARQLALPGMR